MTACFVFTDTYEDNDSFINVPSNIKECPTCSVVWRRALLKEDVISTFKEPGILHKSIDAIFIGYNGREEAGQGDGVFRDALTTFWNQFFNSLAVGAQEKIPAIRHDYQKVEWEAIARIEVYGYVKDGYFPLSLSLGFLIVCLFGEGSVSHEFLLTSFRQYISDDERETFDRCFEDNFMANDEEVIDFLTTYKCFRSQSKENIKQILFEIAHQEIIQKPKYILNCWAPILKSLKVFSDFQSIKGVENMYDAKRPTTKKVLKLIQSEPASAKERQCLDNLKKYIRSLQGDLPVFLQFVTGSDVICFPSIEVTFTVLEGKTRRPIAHTCGPLLELPSTYQSYNELSEEFSELLSNKDAWQFTIV